MFVVLLPPNDKYVVNLNDFSTFQIQKKDENTLQIVCEKFFDGHNSSQSRMQWILLTHEKAEVCEKIFDKMLEALSEGVSVFYIKDHVPEEDVSKPQSEKSHPVGIPLPKKIGLN